MTNGEFAIPPRETLRPSYFTGETHPSVRLDERTEPRLVATAGFLADRVFTRHFASGRTYDSPTMMSGFVYQHLVDIESFHGFAVICTTRGCSSTCSFGPTTRNERRTTDL
ncbi:hypothetical protein [Halomontanus rarus]|uniref:hypothetical protein n=1 Tax=Halomontanus rarus TaxID=3034020 RepID=UPI0023E89900|nr:hypothetical protein [Halovivax sp. TS33]